MQKMTSGKATGLSEVNMEIIVANGEIGVKVMMDLCQRVLNGRGMPDEWKIRVFMFFFNKKGGVLGCGSCKEVKLIEHAMKIVENVLEKQIRTLISSNKMQVGLMPGKGTMDAIFIVSKMQEKYLKKDKKLYVCFVDTKKAFKRVPKKVMEWTMRKNSLLKVMVPVVMSLYDGAKT